MRMPKPFGLPLNTFVDGKFRRVSRISAVFFESSLFFNNVVRPAKVDIVLFSNEKHSQNKFIEIYIHVHLHRPKL